LAFEIIDAAILLLILVTNQSGLKPDIITFKFNPSLRAGVIKLEFLAGFSPEKY
jgi:hypothetical protein